MKSVLVVTHLSAVVLAAIALWSMRYERSEMPATRFEWARAPVLAVIVAALLLYVSPGKRFELWTVAIVVGLAMGVGAGFIVKVNRDFERHLMRVHRTWDGIGAAALLLLLALARLVSSDLTARHSGKFGVLGASAAFLACYLVGRILTLRYYTAPRTIHLDMVRGKKPKTD